MRGLNLDQLRTLETVVELASFTGAARRLNLSQSAVSVQIRELEQERIVVGEETHFRFADHRVHGLVLRGSEAKTRDV